MKSSNNNKCRYHAKNNKERIKIEFSSYTTEGLQLTKQIIYS